MSTCVVRASKSSMHCVFPDCNDCKPCMSFSLGDISYHVVTNRCMMWLLSQIRFALEQHMCSLEGECTSCLLALPKLYMFITSRLLSSISYNLKNRECRRDLCNDLLATGGIAFFVFTTHLQWLVFCFISGVVGFVLAELSFLRWRVFCCLYPRRKSRHIIMWNPWSTSSYITRLVQQTSSPLILCFFLGISEMNFSSNCSSGPTMRMCYPCQVLELGIGKIQGQRQWCCCPCIMRGWITMHTSITLWSKKQRFWEKWGSPFCLDFAYGARGSGSCTAAMLIFVILTLLQRCHSHVQKYECDMWWSHKSGTRLWLRTIWSEEWISVVLLIHFH